jgi:lysozyme family protein
MKANWQSAFTAVLHHEGGYVNNPKDPGGMTNLGCTKNTWEEYCGHPVDEKVMRALTPADVAPLYKRRFWDKIKGDELPAGVDYVVFDCAINSGPGRATKFLQACVGVEVDGDIGPKTLAAVKAFNAKQLIEDYSKRRLSFLIDLPHWDTFGKGWSRRVGEVEATALNMLLKP